MDKNKFGKLKKKMDCFFYMMPTCRESITWPTFDMLSLSHTVKNVCLEHLEGKTQIKMIHQGVT